MAVQVGSQDLRYRVSLICYGSVIVHRTIIIAFAGSYIAGVQQDIKRERCNQGIFNATGLEHYVWTICEISDSGVFVKYVTLDYW